jgi:NADPH:quinone reductase
MKAAVISNGTLVIEDRADPIPGLGEVLVRVRAAGLNNADRMQIQGFYPAPAGSPADIPGLELAGEVVACGPGVVRCKVGDRVMAVVGGGALAELITIHERTLIPVPESVDWNAAGGFPEAFTTAHDSIITQCALTSGERLLVHGAAGGVGMAAAQIGALVGASVVATVRNAELHAAVAGLAPGIAVVDPASFADHGPYDVVIELVGVSNLTDNIRALNIGGRISIIGVGGSGSKGEIDLLSLMSKRAKLMGSTLRARPLEQKADAAIRVEKQLLPHFASGRLRVPIVEAFPLSQVNEAYARFSAGAKFGKIVVNP